MGSTNAFETNIEGSIPQADTFLLRYKILGEIGEGSYSKVLKCKNRETGQIFASKRLKHTYRSWNQVIDIAEIVTLRKLIYHPNILQMCEFHYEPNLGRVNLVFELMDMNLYELIKDRKRLLQESRVRNMMYQLVCGLRHLHKNGIFHRDVKPENILLRRINEEEEVLKLGDLGSVRGLYTRAPYTEYISTRWYRSPECLLSSGYYSVKMDIWATGCVFYEVLTLRPLFPGSSEVDQISRIHNIIGPPPPKLLQKFLKLIEDPRIMQNMKHRKQARFENIKKTLTDLSNGNIKIHHPAKEGSGPCGIDRILPSHISQEARELLNAFLSYDPDLRPSASRTLTHTYFVGLRESFRKTLEDEFKGEVIVAIGKELKTLADIEGDSPDLKTLGETRHKRGPREAIVSQAIETKIPIPAKSSNLVTDSPLAKANEKDESNWKKISSYDEFSSKAKASLPYEIVHLSKRQANIQSDPHLGVRQQPLHVNNSSKQGIANPKQIASSRQVPSFVGNTGQEDKFLPRRNFARDFVGNNTLTSASLKWINENRRLADLQPLRNSKPTNQEPNLSKRSTIEKLGPTPKNSTLRFPNVIGRPGSVRMQVGQRLAQPSVSKVQESSSKTKPKIETSKRQIVLPTKFSSILNNNQKTLENIQNHDRNNNEPTYLGNRLKQRLQKQQLQPNSLTHMDGSTEKPYIIETNFRKAVENIDREVGRKQIENNLSPTTNQPGIFRNNYELPKNPKRPDPKYKGFGIHADKEGNDPGRTTIPNDKLPSSWSIKRKITKENTSSVLDYQEFSARYKNGKDYRSARKRREKSIPINSSSSEILLKCDEDGKIRRRRAHPNDWSPSQDASRSKIASIKPTLRAQKIVDLDTSTSDDKFFESLQKKSSFPMGGGRSEFGLNRKRSNAKMEPPIDGTSGIFDKSSYYPTSYGRIRVSKPSLLPRPSLGNRQPPILQPPPLISSNSNSQYQSHRQHQQHHPEKNPFLHEARENSNKFQREVVARKKYSFLHQKEDFTSSFTSKNQKFK